MSDTMQPPVPSRFDQWLTPEGPESDTVISSRCRLARNLAGLPFSRSAQPQQRDLVARRISEAVAAEPQLQGYEQIRLIDIPQHERTILRESHLISPEMEQSTEQGVVFLSPDMRVSLMVNEEDHLRMQAIDSGYQISEVHGRIDGVDDLLANQLTFAFSPRMGYLTACPTNTGTALRASVMLHLPGLVLAGRIDRMVKEIAQHGFTVRGIYGEGTHCAGDLYQISNEVTLGKSETEIVDGLAGVITQLITRERETRESLFAQRRTFVEDAIWRSHATLCHARLINSAEAITLLSRLRLGVDHALFGDRLTHHGLNRLIIEIQPGHLMAHRETGDDSAKRDAARADLLRERLGESLN